MKLFGPLKNVSYWSWVHNIPEMGEFVNCMRIISFLNNSKQICRASLNKLRQLHFVQWKQINVSPQYGISFRFMFLLEITLVCHSHLFKIFKILCFAMCATGFKVNVSIIIWLCLLIVICSFYPTNTTALWNWFIYFIHHISASCICYNPVYVTILYIRNNLKGKVYWIRCLCFKGTHFFFNFQHFVLKITFLLQHKVHFLTFLYFNDKQYGSQL
jgi:hypothetical protein